MIIGEVFIQYHDFDTNAENNKNTILKHPTEIRCI